MANLIDLSDLVWLANSIRILLFTDDTTMMFAGRSSVELQQLCCTLLNCFVDWSFITRQSLLILNLNCLSTSEITYGFFCVQIADFFLLIIPDRKNFASSVHIILFPNFYYFEFSIEICHRNEFD